MICRNCGNETNVDFTKIPKEIKTFDTKCEHCGSFIKIGNPKYKKEKFETILCKIIGNNDLFWNNTITNYFEENCQDYSEEDRIKFLYDLSIDMDVFNEFTKYIVQKTYDIDNSINVDGTTAKDIANNDPSKNGIEVYIELAKQKNEFEERIVRNSIETAEFVYNHFKGSLLPRNRKMNEIIITKDFIYKKLNGKSTFIKDNEIINKSLEFLQSKSDDIIRLSEEEKNFQHARNDYKDKITIKKNNNWYSINRDVNSVEIQNFYNNLVNDLEIIIN